MNDVARAVGYTSGDRLYNLIRETYWWTTMRRECLEFCQCAVACQIDRAKFPSPPYLFPSNKGLEPFATWAIDCMTGLSPPSPCGGTTIVMAIDAWSKWIEFRIINPLDSRETARFLYDDIICRYGVPAFIRRDQGTEF